MFKALTSIDARLERIEARQRDLENALLDLREKVESIEGQLGEIRFRLGTIEFDSECYSRGSPRYSLYDHSHSHLCTSLHPQYNNNR